MAFSPTTIPTLTERLGLAPKAATFSPAKFASAIGMGDNWGTAYAKAALARMEALNISAHEAFLGRR